MTTADDTKWAPAEKKIDWWSLLGVAFFAGWVACSGYYQIQTLWQKKAELAHVETRVVPALRQQVAIDHKIVAQMRPAGAVPASGIGGNPNEAVPVPTPRPNP